MFTQNDTTQFVKDARTHEELFRGELNHKPPPEIELHKHHAAIDTIDEFRSAAEVKIHQMLTGSGGFERYSEEHRQDEAKKLKAELATETDKAVEALRQKVEAELKTLDNRVEIEEMQAALNDDISPVTLQNKIQAVPSVLARFNSFDEFKSYYSEEVNPITRRAIQEVGPQHISQKWQREIGVNGFIKQLAADLQSGTETEGLRKARQRRADYNFVTNRFDGLRRRYGDYGPFRPEPEPLHRPNKRVPSSPFG